MAALTTALLRPANVGAEPRHLELHWEAPAAECPDESAVRHAVAELLGRSNASTEHSTLRMHSRVSHVDGRWGAELSWLEDETESKRRLEAATCDELARAAAIVIAFAVDPESAQSTADKPREPVAAPTPGTSNSVSLQVAPPQKPTPKPPFLPAPLASTQTEHDTPRPKPLAVFTRALLATDLGSLPGPAAGVSLGIGARLTPWIAKMEASVYRSQEETSPEGSGRFLLGDAALFPCYEFRRAQLSVQPCAIIALQLIRGDGQDLRTVDGGYAWLLRSGLGAELEYALSARIGVTAGAYGLVAPSRPSFVLDGRTVLHRPELVTVRCTVGMEIRLN